MKMGTHTGSVMTLANSIIGVSVLAMPFCFKQCGIVLSILMLLFSSIVSRLACHYLMKSAIMEKRKNFEMLAFRAFGPTGKLTVELCVIGFLLGTCVAYFVVVGDLGPAILAPVLGFQHPTALRPSVLVAVGVFVVLPLGLLRNVDSLTTLSAVSIAFYLCLVFKVMGEATTNILSWSWVDKVHYWRPSGVLQCVPIFSMALSCQTQLFEIFDSVPNTPIDRMNAVVRSAVNMTTMFYIAVGFFGYVAFCNQPFSGNLMLSFSPTLTSDVIKLGFVLSVAVSFPLVIFPCRASIYSLLFSKGPHYSAVMAHEAGTMSGGSHIPESKFQAITLAIVTTSLVTGLVSPNIELVLGLVGSTIGAFVCLVFPALIFVSLSNRNTNERLLAKLLVGAGLLIMVLGTYTNLSVSHVSEVEMKPPSLELKPILEAVVKTPLTHLSSARDKIVIKEETLKELKDVEELAALPELRADGLKKAPAPIVIESGSETKKTKKQGVKEGGAAPARQEGDVASEKGRQEPPVPVAPISVQPVVEQGEEMKKRKKTEKKKLDPKKADELIEKLIKHEEAHKRLLSEGKQLIDELKNSAPGAQLNDVVLNKSDVIKVVDLPPPKSANGAPLPPALLLKEGMARRMAKGVPLPVAALGENGGAEVAIGREESGKRNEVVGEKRGDVGGEKQDEAQGGKRVEVGGEKKDEVLGGKRDKVSGVKREEVVGGGEVVKEERGKRDLEEVERKGKSEKSGSVSPKASEGECDREAGDNFPRPKADSDLPSGKDDSTKVAIPAGLPKANSSLANNLPKANDLDSTRSGPPKANVGLTSNLPKVNDLDSIQSGTSNVSPKINNSLPNRTNDSPSMEPSDGSTKKVLDDLIRAPTFLSDPGQLALGDGAPLDLGASPDRIPQPRDLKSLGPIIASRPIKTETKKK